MIIKPPPLPEPQEPFTWPDECLRFIMQLTQKHATEIDLLRRDHALEVKSLKDRLNKEVYLSRKKMFPGSDSTQKN